MGSKLLMFSFSSHETLNDDILHIQLVEIDTNLYRQGRAVLYLFYHLIYTTDTYTRPHLNNLLLPLRKLASVGILLLLQQGLLFLDAGV